MSVTFVHIRPHAISVMDVDFVPLVLTSGFPPACAADQLPSALRLSEEQWQQQYRFPKPRPHDPVVMQCRTNRRAAWAAQLAQDAGLQNCLVYRQVTAACQCMISSARMMQYCRCAVARAYRHNRCCISRSLAATPMATWRCLASRD